MYKSIYTPKKYMCNVLLITLTCNENVFLSQKMYVQMFKEKNCRQTLWHPSRWKAWKQYISYFVGGRHNFLYVEDTQLSHLIIYGVGTDLACEMPAHQGEQSLSGWHSCICMSFLTRSLKSSWKYRYQSCNFMYLEFAIHTCTIVGVFFFFFNQMC